VANLGEFGTPHEPEVEESDAEPLEFGWFGVTIHLATSYSQVTLVDLMESARSVDEADPTAMVIVKDMLRLFINAGDFGTFWRIAKQQNQTLEDLTALMQGLMAALTDRPTPQQSDSSAGLLPTAESLPADSATPASRGRPDLQLVLEQGAESRARLAAAMG